MREDMFKVVVERPRARASKWGYERAERLRNDMRGPAQLPMRTGYDDRDLNENLAPLR